MALPMPELLATENYLFKEEIVSRHFWESWSFYKVPILEARLI